MKPLTRNGDLTNRPRAIGQYWHRTHVLLSVPTR